MDCINPVTIRNANYDMKEGEIGMLVPCGKCIPCRIQRSREWAVRMLHESYLHGTDNVFITLTYSDEFLPSSLSLKKRDLQLFFKRFRKYIEVDGKVLKYYACGEYGDNTFRPHYHAIIFGIGKDYLECYKPNVFSKYDASKVLEKVWNYGMNTVGDVSYDSCRYVADYVMKKYSGKKEKEDYINKGLESPFCLISKGIGKEYVLSNSDYFRDNLGCTINGNNVGFPRYYRKVLQIDSAEMYEKAKTSGKMNKIKAWSEAKGFEIDEIKLGQAIKDSLKQNEVNIISRKSLTKKGKI